MDFDVFRKKAAQTKRPENCTELCNTAEVESLVNKLLKHQTKKFDGSCFAKVIDGIQIAVNKDNEKTMKDLTAMGMGGLAMYVGPWIPVDQCATQRVKDRSTGIEGYLENTKEEEEGKVNQLDEGNEKTTKIVVVTIQGQVKTERTKLNDQHLEQVIKITVH